MFNFTTNLPELDKENADLFKASAILGDYGQSSRSDCRSVLQRTSIEASMEHRRLAIDYLGCHRYRNYDDARHHRIRRFAANHSLNVQGRKKK